MNLSLGHGRLAVQAIELAAAAVRNIPHQTVEMWPSLPLVGLSFSNIQVAYNCRATRPACLAVHLDSSAGLFMMSAHSPNLAMLAAWHQNESQRVAAFLRSLRLTVMLRAHMTSTA